MERSPTLPRPGEGASPQEWCLGWSWWGVQTLEAQGLEKAPVGGTLSTPLSTKHLVSHASVLCLFSWQTRLLRGWISKPLNSAFLPSYTHSVHPNSSLSVLGLGPGIRNFHLTMSQMENLGRDL